MIYEIHNRAESCQIRTENATKTQIWAMTRGGTKKHGSSTRQQLPNLLRRTQLHPSEEDDLEKTPRKNRRVNEATDQWKNLGCWKDLSQLLSSCTRQALRSEIGKTNFKVLNIAVFDGHLDPIVKCDANARAGHKSRNHVAAQSG